MVKKAIFKGSIFLFIIMLIIVYLGPIFTVKISHRYKLIQGLYEHTGNAYDVALMGSSHMNSGIDPNVLWNEYGITSMNYATGGQTIDVTYYVLKEALKNHKFSVVVVDLYYLGLTGKYGDEGYIRNVLDNMRFSENKFEAILNCTPSNQWIAYFFPFYKYHNRWKDLKQEDFKPDDSTDYFTKGFGAGHDMYGKDSLSDISTTETSDIPPKTKDYLYKFIDLSKKEGFKLVFMNAPHDYTETESSTDWVKEPAKMFNKVAEISKENGIPFINYNNMFDEIGFDFKTDMYNMGHMNVQGAQKVSTNLGKFLKDNYKLADHRNDPKYSKWNEDYDIDAQTEAALYLTEEQSIKKYISMLKNKNYIVAVSCNNFTLFNDNKLLKKGLTDIGLKAGQSDMDDNYIAVINNNSVVSETSSSTGLKYSFTLENGISLSDATSNDDTSMPSIMINGHEYSSGSSGFNIVVYDKLLNRVVDSICLDSNNRIKR